MSMDDSRLTSTINSLVMFGLRTTGIWPDEPYKIWFRIFWATSILLVLVSEYWYMFTDIDFSNFPDLMDVLSMAITFNLALLKMISLWLSRRTLCEILAKMARDWKESSSSNFRWIARTMVKKAVLSDRLSKSIIATFAIAVVLYGSSICLSLNWQDKHSKERQQLIKMKFPFDSNSSPVYEIVLVAQFVYLLVFAITVPSVLNAFLLTLVFHIGGQIDVIRQALGNISAHGEKPESIGLTLNALIGRHQRIISLSDNIESLFTYIALMQFLSNTLVICALGFVIITSFNTKQGYNILMKVSGYYFSMNLEAFIYCYAGEYLSNKSSAVGNAAYEFNWYNLNLKKKRLLILLILRSQKRLCITIGKFMELSLPCFTSILKISISYISVLYALY